jgi:hypothetical protein
MIKKLNFNQLLIDLKDRDNSEQEGQDIQERQGINL